MSSLVGVGLLFLILMYFRSRRALATMISNELLSFLTILFKPRTLAEDCNRFHGTSDILMALKATQMIIWAVVAARPKKIIKNQI